MFGFLSLVSRSCRRRSMRSYLGKIVDEECNNHDDNCNQLVDEDLLSLCYSADPQTMGIGICQPGYLYCKEGVWGNDFTQALLFQIYVWKSDSMQEDICNGEDTNCDGITEKEQANRYFIYY